MASTKPHALGDPWFPSQPKAIQGSLCLWYNNYSMSECVKFMGALHEVLSRCLEPEVDPEPEAELEPEVDQRATYRARGDLHAVTG